MGLDKVGKSPSLGDSGFDLGLSTDGLGTSHTGVYLTRREKMCSISSSGTPTKS